MTFLTMTTRHESEVNNTSGISPRIGIADNFRLLQEGKRMFMKRLSSIERGVNYMMVVEPHGSGYPHYHMIIFKEFTIGEQLLFKHLWEDGGYGSFEHGLDFDMRPAAENIKSLRNYLMKYMSKSFIDYESKYVSCPWTKEQLLFNAVAWFDHYRTWCASNELSKVMKQTIPDVQSSVDWNETVIEDGAGEIRTVWRKHGVDELETSADMTPEFNSIDAKNRYEVFSSDLVPFEHGDAPCVRPRRLRAEYKTPYTDHDEMLTI
jgi:hypothetical protein